MANRRTLQEGIAASENSVVFCGSDEIPWLEVLNAMKYLSGAGATRHANALVMQTIRLFFEVYASHRTSQAVRLDELIHLSILRQASNPLDLIYALYGLVKGSKKYLLKPDYSALVEELYQHTMLYIIEDRGDLDFLIHAARQRSSTLPSWCVDFSTPYELDPLDISYTGSFQRFSTKMAGASSGRLLSRIAYHVDCKGLETAGAIVGTVESTKRPFARHNCDMPVTDTDRTMATTILRDDMLLRDMHALTDFVREAWAPCLDTDAIDMKIEDGDVWKLAANGRQIGVLTGATSNSVSRYGAIARLEKQCERQSKSVWTRMMGGWRPPAHDLKVLRHVFRELIDLSGHCLRVFATDTGYVGSCYTDVQVNDVVCILFGCRLPLVMRPTGDGTYNLVDAVYVDGIMGGGFLWDKADCAETKFILV